MPIRLFTLKTGLLSPYFHEALELVTPSRQKKTLRYLKIEDRLRSLSAGLLLRHALGVTSDEELLLGPYGRLELIALFPHFSLSHSGDYAALSVADIPHGLDMENLERGLNYKAIAKRIFTGDEYRDNQERLTEPLFFFSVFTRKESLMKATGLGFHLDPRSFPVSPLDFPSFEVLGDSWYFKSLIMDKHIFTLAAKGEPITIEHVELSPKDILESA
ncbi:MAG: 4'-phosphopantetheinyl transferase superfamily protein [Deltaproteobacteria bacterium]|nr:4'-phosphopantetheinyl transferase superfamily protein [Deltaproteobacteria bacterium]